MSYIRVIGNIGALAGLLILVWSTSLGQCVKNPTAFLPLPNISDPAVDPGIMVCNPSWRNASCESH